jgi:hypothetical protein
VILALLALHVAIQQNAPPPRVTPPAVVRDSTTADPKVRNAPRRLPVTAAVLASAFHDSSARDLFTRARRSRIAQDSSLASYDAKVNQRISVSAGIGRIGRERLAFRQETSSRVQWQRGVGARIEMTGARLAIPIVGSAKEEREALQRAVVESGASPIPYFPGSETIWIGGLTARTEVDERRLVNPLAEGSEAYYTYRTGDSVSFRLPDAKVIRLRELIVRPRKAEWNLVVGSLWFDTGSGQLVRAAYRLAVPMQMAIGVSREDTTRKPSVVQKLVTGMFSPNTAEVSAVSVEYGLYEGRFWLPRSQSMEGLIRAMFARVPLRLEHAFSYASVNGTMSLAAIQVDTTLREGGPRRPQPPDSLEGEARQKWLDSARVVYAAARKAYNDSVSAGLPVGSLKQCDGATGTRVVTRYRFDSRMPVEMRVPCDLDSLTRSADLPASIYDSGDEIYGSTEREALIADALSMAAQAPFSLAALPAPRLQFGPTMTRYNRVEGFSTGLLVEQQLGGGYAATAIGRLGTADRRLNAELSLARTNATRTIRLGGYHRLVSANDWGSPLSFGSSVSAFLFGRDEGFYYRAAGADVQWTSDRGPRLDWRLFAERQRTAEPRTDFSLGAGFGPNIVTDEGTYAGLGVRHQLTYGLNPRGFRAYTDLRLEGAGGESGYGRAALDVTLSRSLVRGVDGAVTLAGGTSVGELPVQRWWFLGGSETIRGQRADIAQSGDAFWMTRLELARPLTGARVSLFGDLGWAGDRTRLADIGRPLSGVGIGYSALDGLIRLDVARGIYPREQTRVNLYLDARF